jgi:hypothetical protein
MLTPAALVGLLELAGLPIPSRLNALLLSSENGLAVRDVSAKGLASAPYPPGRLVGECNMEGARYSLMVCRYVGYKIPVVVVVKVSDG